MYSCEISEKEDITVFSVNQLNLRKNLNISNNQELRITQGNFTLNGFNLSLTSSSLIKVENGCLGINYFFKIQ